MCARNRRSSRRPAEAGTGWGDTTGAHATDARRPAGRRPTSVAEIRDAYAECADWMDRLDWLDRYLTGRYRREAFGSAEGCVLDVACGTGTNFPYLPTTVDFVGIDISPEMLSKAERRLDGLELDGAVRPMDARDLAFDDDAFDTVISSLSTRTFPDPIAALREMDRVRAPDGRILLFEHGRSDVGPIARFQTGAPTPTTRTPAVGGIRNRWNSSSRRGCRSARPGLERSGSSRSSRPGRLETP